jgi:hypothetical protein
VGTARSEDELAELAQARCEIEFDPDIYKILVSYVAKHPGAVKLVPKVSESEELALCSFA